MTLNLFAGIDWGVHFKNVNLRGGTDAEPSAIRRR